MKKQILGLIFCGGALLSYGQDTTGQSQNENVPMEGIVCSALDEKTLACFSQEVDVDKDNMVSEEEWNNADPNSIGIIDISPMVSGGSNELSGSQEQEMTEPSVSEEPKEEPKSKNKNKSK